MSQKLISAYVVFFGEKILESASVRSSGTRTAPSRTSPPYPTGTARPVIVLKTVVFPEPANPTSPIFIVVGLCPENLREMWTHDPAQREARSAAAARRRGWARSAECGDASTVTTKRLPVRRRSDCPGR